MIQPVSNPSYDQAPSVKHTQEEQTEVRPIEKESNIESKPRTEESRQSPQPSSHVNLEENSKQAVEQSQTTQSETPLPVTGQQKNITAGQIVNAVA